MKLDHLRYFDRLADVLSYTNAAKSLYIAQPTLSAATTYGARGGAYLVSSCRRGGIGR